MKTFNKVMLKGRIHSYELDEKDTTEKGTPIAGTVTLEVDEKGTLVDTRFFAYPKYNNGNVNRTYGFLSDLMAGNYQTISDGGDEVDWLSIDGTVNPDYFVPRDGAKSVDDLAHSQKVRGSFINTNNKHEYMNQWKCDTIVTKVEDIEENVEKGYPHKIRVYGYIIDDYNERLMGVRFEAMDEAPMRYLSTLSPSEDNPIYTSIRGEFRKVTSLKVIEGAFGEDEKIEYDNLFWVLVWMPKNTYVFGEDISLEDFQKFHLGLDDYRKEKLEKHNEENNEDPDLVF